MSAVIYERLLPAAPESVSRIRHGLGAALMVCVPDGQRRSDIALFVTEAASNAVRHAYGNTPGAVYATAEVRDRWLTIAISDWGRGLSPDAKDPGASTPAAAKSRGGGLGIVLMTRLADGSSIDSDASGTDVEGAFELAGAAGRYERARDVRGNHGRMPQEYVRVLGDTTDVLRQDTAAVIAEVRQAVAHSRERRRARKHLH